MIKIFKTFKVAVCGCGHTWTTTIDKPRCSSCEKRLRNSKTRYALRPFRILEDEVQPVVVHCYFAVRNPFK